MDTSIEISVNEIEAMDSRTYYLIDLRDESSFSYGHLPGAICVPENVFRETYEQYKDRNIIVYCKRGEVSAEVVEWLADKGISAKHVPGGYLTWLLDVATTDDENRKSARDIEESIRKKFHSDIWCRFTKAVKDYELVKEGDKIAVCISGGKDSMLMAKLFQELKKHNKVHFETEFIVMNPGYSDDNLAIIKSNAAKLDIPIKIFETNIFDAVYTIEKSPCYLCARMRRGHLYYMAEQLGCNKIALGHHYDDVIETILMGMLYGAQVQTMMPKLHSTNFGNMELIRPMYLIREDSIKAWRDYNKLGFIQCACRFTDTCTTCTPDKSSVSKRQEIKMLIREMKKTNPFVEGNIFKSVENVNLSTIIAYKDADGRHHFLDDY